MSAEGLRLRAALREDAGKLEAAQQLLTELLRSDSEFSTVALKAAWDECAAKGVTTPQNMGCHILSKMVKRFISDRQRECNPAHDE